MVETLIGNITNYAETRLFALPTPPPSPLTPLSSPLPQIPSPPTHHPLPLLASSLAAELKYPRLSCRLRRGYYLLLPHLDTSIHASEEKAMAAVESVNLRVNYQASVHRREIKEFQTLLETQAYRHERSVRTQMIVILKHIMHIQALEAGSRVDILEDTDSSA
ncbi:hypothetical protein Tco_1090224 [Tanacetum coccineum]|uniref:Uncharacterized protein n=1 Tax=Tanacetum coccineum TaxID=301880 RepID=A0ABQ5I4S1_9ASTR